MGVVPIASSIARRRNSASVQSGEGTSPSSRHLAAALLSTTFCDGNSNGRFARERHREPGHRRAALVADHDAGLAPADGPGDPAGLTVATPSLRVSNRAASVTSRSEPSLRAGDHGESLLLARLHHPATRDRPSARRPSGRLARARRPLFQPERQQPISRRTGFQPLAAAVGHSQRRLEQDQALLGCKRRDPPLFRTLDDRRVIGSRARSPVATA